MTLEIGKKYLREVYNGNLDECIKKRDGVEWTEERIKRAFNYGNGTEFDLKRYIDDNSEYAYFVTI